MGDDKTPSICLKKEKSGNKEPGRPLAALS
jgi:hypothetical protein